MLAIVSSSIESAYNVGMELGLSSPLIIPIVEEKDLPLAKGTQLVIVDSDNHNITIGADALKDFYNTRNTLTIDASKLKSVIIRICQCIDQYTSVDVDNICKNVKNLFDSYSILNLTYGMGYLRELKQVYLKPMNSISEDFKYLLQHEVRNGNYGYELK